MRLKPCYFMAPEDSSPGGGSPPAGGGASPPGSATAAPASGTAPAATAIDPAALAREVAAAVGPQVRDSIFAELRKSGVLGGKAGQAPQASTAETPPAASGASALSLSDVETLLASRETFARELARFDIPDSAIARARQALNVEKPSDVASWAKTYATDMGWKERAAPSAAAATTTPNPTAAAAAAAATASHAQGDPKPIAASSTAPGGGDSTPSELVDITKLSAEQRLRLGPEGIRAALDRAAEAGYARDGRPRIPEVLRTKR